VLTTASAPAADEHLLDRGATADGCAFALGTSDERVGERLHPTARERPAMAMPEQLQEQAEGAARGGGGRKPGVLGGAREPCGGTPVTFEEVEAERLCRAGQPPYPLEPVPAQRRGKAHRRADRGQPRQHSVDQR
jgi:hypothetical protein